MRNLYLSFLLIFLFGCSTPSEIETYGAHYREHQDLKSLEKVVELIPLDADTAYIKKLLGEPIDMGFDYRYLVDSTGPNNCVIGAVFHLDGNGGYDQKWVDQICE